MNNNLFGGFVEEAFTIVIKISMTLGCIVCVFMHICLIIIWLLSKPQPNHNSTYHNLSWV